MCGLWPKTSGAPMIDAPASVVVRYVPGSAVWWASYEHSKALLLERAQGTSGPAPTTHLDPDDQHDGPVALHATAGCDIHLHRPRGPCACSCCHRCVARVRESVSLNHWWLLVVRHCCACVVQVHRWCCLLNHHQPLGDCSNTAADPRWLCCQLLESGRVD